MPHAPQERETALKKAERESESTEERKIKLNRPQQAEKQTVNGQITAKIY